MGYSYENEQKRLEELLEEMLSAESDFSSSFGICLKEVPCYGR